MAILYITNNFLNNVIQVFQDINSTINDNDTCTEHSTDYPN